MSSTEKQVENEVVESDIEFEEGSSRGTRVTDRLKAGLVRTWEILGPKLADTFTVLVLVATLANVWKENKKWRGRARMLNWLTLCIVVALGPMWFQFGVWYTAISFSLALATVLFAGWKVRAMRKKIRTDAVTDVAKILGVRLGVEGLKVMLRMLASRGRAEERMVEDLADSLTSDSLVGIYFFLGMFHADNIKSLFTDTTKFARMSRTLAGPFDWIRQKAEALMAMDYVNPWWLSSPMPAVRRAFAGHWINFEFLGFQPFLFLRRNGGKAAASGFVMLSALMVWKFLPKKKEKPKKFPARRLRGAALWRKRIDALRAGRPEEGGHKSLNKGKGKNKGRAQAVRAVGSRAKRVKSTRAGNRGGSNNRNTTVSSMLHWYDDDQVRVYDPMRGIELDMILGSSEFKDLYKTIRASGMAEQALIHNSRTDEITNFYGVTEGANDADGYDDYKHDDYYENQDYDEAYGYQESSGYHLSRQVVHEELISSGPFFSTMCVSDATLEEESRYDDDGSRKEESSLGRDRIVLSKFKGGVARNGDDSVSVILISGRMILMKHFVDKVEGKTFIVVLGGAEYRVDKNDGCPLGTGGELLTFAQPRDLHGFRSSRLHLGVPAEGLNGSEVILVRFNDDGPCELSAGKWHDGSYSAFSQPGWCGSAVMVFPTKGPATMVGVHRWGVGPDGLNACEPFDIETINYFKKNPPHPV